MTTLRTEIGKVAAVADNETTVAISRKAHPPTAYTPRLSWGRGLGLPEMPSHARRSGEVSSLKRTLNGTLVSDSIVL